MSAPVPALQGRGAWLTTPSRLAALLGLGLAALYLWCSLDFPPGSQRPLFGVLGAVAVLGHFVSQALEQARLRPLLDLAAGRVKVAPAGLAAAGRAVAQAPDVTFLVVLGFVAGGAMLTALGWRAWSGVAWPVALRVGFIGLALAPVTAVFGYLLLLPRERALLATLLSLGLPGEALLTGGRGALVLRHRFTVYALVAVLSPLVLVTDLALWRADRLAEALAGGVTGEAAAALAATQSQTELTSLLLLAGLVLALVAGSAWLSGSALGRPLAALAAQTGQLARGAWGQAVAVPAEHETWAAAWAILCLDRELAGLVQGLTAAGAGITSAVDALGAGADQQRLGAESQAETLVATTATTGELARSARQIASHAQRVATLAQSTLEAALEGRRAALGFTVAMTAVRDGNQGIADAVVRLNKRVQHVGRVVEFIDSIAERSDLLALNAELEGHRAGEPGRGFSLVAAEMKRLAESVLSSTREIGRLLEDIRDATHAAVMATEAGVKASDTSSGMAQGAAEGIDRIVEVAQQAAQAMQGVTTATLQQQAGSDQLVKAMEAILTSTQEGAQAAGGLRLANTGLAALAAELDAAVRQLKGAA